MVFAYQIDASFKICTTFIILFCTSYIKEHSILQKKQRLPLRRIPKDKKVDPRWLAVGTKTEMEHTKDRKVARQIATQHLIEHPTYYRVLPAAEQTMGMLENKRPPVKKRRAPVRRSYNPMTDGLPPGIW